MTLHIINTSPTTLKKLKTCRLFLQVTLLSDISTIREDKLLQSALTRERLFLQNSTLQWPKKSITSIFVITTNKIFSYNSNYPHDYTHTTNELIDASINDHINIRRYTSFSYR